MRKPALLRIHPSVPTRGGPGKCHPDSRDADPILKRFPGIENKTDPGQRQGSPGHGYPARYHCLPQRASAGSGYQR